MHEAFDRAVIDLDVQLAKTVDRTRERLCRHRWYWTLNPENPNRVPLKTYAISVGRSYSTVRTQANGYARWLADPSISLNDHVELANMGAERAEVSKRVAQIYGLSGSTARQELQGVISDLVAQTKEKTEPGKVSFEEALDDVVEFHRKSKESRERRQQTHLERHGIKFVGVDNQVTRAINAIHKALQEAKRSEWSDQERQILTEGITRLRGYLGLLEVALTGSTEVDWDAELAQLGVA